MNRDQFHQYLNYPDRLDSGTLEDLDNIVKEYPYFQAARMLLVKNLKNEDNILLNKQLRKTAACINDRQLLFGLLNNISVDSEGNLKRIGGLKVELPQDQEPMEGAIFSLDNKPVSESGNDIDEAPAGEKSVYIRELERFIPIADMDLLLIDYPDGDSDILDFDFDENLPEVEVADDTAGDEDVMSVSPGKSLKTKDLIDDFIRNNPRMPQPILPSKNTDDISLKSLDESDAFMTETLAEIYFKQGYYYRALQAYEKLSLKYPQKSIYFAAQIQKIKELITNQ